MGDARDAAARYRARRVEKDLGLEPGDSMAATGGDDPPVAHTEAERAAIVETAIQLAIRRGEFDDLPGSGKPLEGLSDHHDPDWWIRRKIETERLSGLGPPALTLRVESAQLRDRLDAFGYERDVRDTVEDFNRRVIEARRQLQGGPPVVTAPRDVEDEVAAWRARREQQAQRDAAAEPARPPARRWFRRARA